MTPAFTEKPWGYEFLWALGPSYQAKVLVVAAGKRTSLQVHELKHETMMLLRGEAVLNGEAMEPFVPRAIAPGEPHRLENRRPDAPALVVEVSTICDGTDIVRLEDDYGRALVHEARNLEIFRGGGL